MNITDNLKLGTHIYGKIGGIPLVITPGWATDCRFLEPLVKLFSDYEVILIDMPGYGLSRNLAQFSSSIRQTGNLLLNTIPKECILMSWSLSTLSCISALGADKESKIKKFISLCGTPRFPCDPNWPGVDYKYVLKSQKLFNEEANQRSIKLFFKLQTQTNGYSKEINEWIMDCFTKMGEIDTLVLKNGLNHMSFSDLRDTLNHVTIPCLHIFGQKDRLVKAELVNKLTKAPFHTCTILKNSAHMPFITEPELLKETVNSFINSK